MTAIVPGVEASCAAVTATRGNIWVVGAGPPPALEIGFFGFVTLMLTLPAVVRSLAGRVIVNEVPAALAVPVNGPLLPMVTCVELLNPVPVSVICWEVTPVPTIRPVLGENEDCVGTALSMLVGASVADLSVVTVSPGSETEAVFVTVKTVGEEMAFGPTDTFSVSVLLPPAAASAGPE